jgi:hypothetical protein
MKFFQIHLSTLIVINSFLYVKSQKFSSFSSIKNREIDPTNDSKYLISKFKAFSDTDCQTTCNYNNDCSSIFYNRNDGTCSFYSKVFLFNQMIEASNSDFFIKNSK